MDAPNAGRRVSLLTHDSAEALSDLFRHSAAVTQGANPTGIVRGPALAAALASDG